MNMIYCLFGEVKRREIVGIREGKDLSSIPKALIFRITGY